MEVFYRHSAALIFRLLSISLKSQYWNYLRVSVDYTCKCNAEISLVFNVSTKQCAALLFSCYLFCSSLNHEALQIFDRLCSAKLCFKSFTFLLMDFSYRHSAALILRLLSILLKSQYWNYLRVSVDYTCKCNAEISLVFNVSTKQCAALILSRFLFCSSLNHEGLQIFDRLCSAKLCFKSFTILLMEVFYRHSAALLFTLFLHCSSFNVETVWEFRWTTLANVMLRFRFGFQCLH